MSMITMLAFGILISILVLAIPSGYNTADLYVSVSNYAKDGL